MKKLLFTFFLSVSIFVTGFSQETGNTDVSTNDETEGDSIAEIPEIDSMLTIYHSPAKASMLSAVVPGLGQIYNKRYWKVPIIYVGAAALVYSMQFAQVRYDRFHKAYVLLNDGDPSTLNEFEKIGDERYTSSLLSDWQDFYRRNRDLSIMGLAGLYIVNIIDATVDAYLFDYEVTPDVTLRIRPSMINSGYSTNFALSCSLRF
jgi:hypothetical protein